MRSASFLIVATSLAVAQAAAIKRTPLTERNLEELVTRQTAAFRGGECQTQCAAWFQSLDVCQALFAGNWQQLGNCLCQPEARAAIPDCLKCVDDDGDSVGGDKSDADYDDLSDFDSIADESDLEDALEDIAGVCIRYHGAVASSLLLTPTPANSAPAAQPTLTRTKSSDSLDADSLDDRHDDKHDDDHSDDELDDGNDSDDDD